MSRLEKTLEKKNKKRKFKIIKRIIFITFLILNATICICIVDISAQSMLGNDIKVEDRVDDIKKYIDQTMQNINNISLNIKEQIKR